MENILLTVDNDPVDENAIDFACHLARLTRSRLTGIFLDEPVTEPEVVVESQTTAKGTISITIAGFDQESEQAAQHEENIGIFRDWAEKSGVPFSVYLDKGVPAAELIFETRYADVLLMYAEALNQVNSGPNATAYSMINSVRSRAGLPALTPGLSQGDFALALERERRSELAFEGHRWFDLLRTGRALTVMNNHFRGSVTVQAFRLLYPLPQTAVSVNPDRIKQNPGY